MANRAASSSTIARGLDGTNFIVYIGVKYFYLDTGGDTGGFTAFAFLAVRMLSTIVPMTNAMSKRVKNRPGVLSRTLVIIVVYTRKIFLRPA
jgi:hypothetical protein